MNLVEGPFGVEVPDSLARLMEESLKDLPADCKSHGYKRVATMGKAETAEDERTDVSVITSEALDRDNEVMLADGINWDQFTKAGMPVTFAHDYKALPIGRGLWVKSFYTKSQPTRGWKGKTQYATRPDDWEGPWMADGVWHLVKGGMLNGKSIGFIPTLMREATPDEIRVRPELKKASVIIAKSIALEWAVAPVAANQEALVQEVSKKEFEGLGILEAVTFVEVVEPVEEQLTYKQLKEAHLAQLTTSLDAGLVKEVLKPTLKSYLVRKQEEMARLKSCLTEATFARVVQDSIDLIRGRV